MKTALLFFFAVACGMLLIFFVVRSGLLKPVIKNPQDVGPSPTPFSLEAAPKQSLTGEIISFSGEVFWQSRTATEAAKLQTRKPLHQGENLETKENSTLTFNFPDLGTIAMLPKSKLDIIQTLPVNIVLTQQSGTITYTKSGQLPLSIRTLHLLLNPLNGEMTVSTTEKAKNIRVHMASGSAQVAYEDSENVTQVFTLYPDETFIFDDEAREVTTL